MPASESDTIADFLDAMRSAGVNIDTASNKGGHPIADGKLHRAAALGKKSKRNLHVWYILYVDDPASGAFGDYQAGISDTWTAKRGSQMTPEEKAALKKRMQDAQRERAEDLARVNAEAANAAEAILANCGKASPDHAYLARKDLPPFPGLRQLKSDVRYTIDGEEKRARGGNLVVPLFTPEGKVASVQIIQPDGTKRFLKGTAKAGNYTSIGKPSDRIIIAEGWSTAARCHQATGLCVIVAFDSGNLLPVAKSIRAKYPEAELIFAADNDRLVVQPVNNPGVTKAREAAEAVKGLVAVPIFADGADEGATDFDDLARIDGLHAVKEALDGARPPNVVDLKTRARQDEAPPPDDAPPHDAMPDGPPSEPEAGWDEPEFEANPLDDFGRPHFRCLGVDGRKCFYQPADVGQIIELDTASHKPENLMLLAPLQWWEVEFPGEKGTDWKAAVNACIRACKHRRKFVSHKHVRGRGAWFEGDTAVFHAGDHLVIDGEPYGIPEHASRFVYDEGEGIPVALQNPADTAEARKLLQICKSLRWNSPLSGYLLAGFCVVAPVCGFLDWRPHVWINGPAGAGKSTVMDKIVKAALGSTAVSIVGNTTEAGIRAHLNMDALPIIFDESEPKDMHSQARIRAILDLARVASSEADGVILKGTSNQSTKGFRARFMAVFASINTQIEGYADETRFTQLTLAKPDTDTPEAAAAAKAHYEKLVSDMVDLLTPSFSRRLLARTILNLPTLREYVRVFTEAATLHLGTKRLGDQIGPMLAGAYLLNGTGHLTVEKALEWIRTNDWADHSAKSAAKDQDRFLSVITSHMVRYQTPEYGTWERTIGELIEMAAGPDTVREPSEFGGFKEVENKPRSAASAALARYGIRVYHDGASFMVDITTTYEGFKNKVLRGTEWAGTNIRNLLKNVEGAINGKGNRYFAPGVNTPYVTVPMAVILGERDPGEEG